MLLTIINYWKNKEEGYIFKSACKIVARFIVSKRNIEGETTYLNSVVNTRVKLLMQ